MPIQEIDPRDLRRAFGAFATGVTVVTTTDGERRPWGFTANSFTSVSLDPPLVLICIAKTAGSCPVFEKAGHFAINILAESQRGLSGHFASPKPDKFDGIACSAKVSGSPVLDGTVAWLDCAMHEVVDAGDHYILIGRVIAYDYSSEPPLGYCRGAYVSFGLAQEAQHVQEATGQVQIGALVECEDHLLFYEEPESGALKLPLASKLGDGAEPKSLLGRLAAAGLDVQLPFLYAVYDKGDRHIIVYRGQADSRPDLTQDAAGRMCFIKVDSIPWDRIADPALKSMLERYQREKIEDQFGLYVGDHEVGQVRRVPHEGRPSKV
ncbi:MAG: flavin reductase family protein [Pseudomonadota bacterium]